MTRQSSVFGSAGVHGIDFEMKEELVKPWVAITNFYRRFRLFGRPNGPGWLGFLLTLTTSVCLLLQGAAINTVGLPKARWSPDLWPHSKTNDASMTMSTPQMNLTSIDWTDYRYTGLNTVRRSLNSEEDEEIALASASTYVTLNLLDSIYQNSPGWSNVVENYTYITVINTNISTSTVQSISVQGSAIIDMYNEAKNNDLPFAKLSTGMIGTVNLTVPMLMTRCDTEAATNLSAGTILVQLPEPSASNGSLGLQIASDSRMNFTGAYCVLSLQQVYFPVQFWLDYPGPGGLHFDQQTVGLESLAMSPISSIEVANLRHLGMHFSAMLPHLDGLLPKSSFAEHLLLEVRRLKAARSGFETEIESLTAAVALILQYMITTANWNMTASPTERITSFPVRWHVYGSGPRLFWEWATGAVLCVLILTILFDVFLMLRYRMAPGPWLTLHGMMHAANSIDMMRHACKGCAGVAAEDSERVKYYVRDIGNWQAEVTDDADKGILLEEGKRYGELEHRLKDCINDITCKIHRRR